MTTDPKTILEEIRARGDEPGYTLADYAWTLAELGSAKEASLLAELLEDRETLLAMLDEVAEFQKRIQLDADAVDGRLDDLQQERQDYADDLRAILEKK